MHKHLRKELRAADLLVGFFVALFSATTRLIYYPRQIRKVRVAFAPSRRGLKFDPTTPALCVEFPHAVFPFTY